MKKRIFYVVNLDRGRILTISFIFTGFLIIAFVAGYRLGHIGESVGIQPGNIEEIQPESSLSMAEFAGRLNNEDESSQTSGDSETEKPTGKSIPHFQPDDTDKEAGDQISFDPIESPRQKENKKPTSSDSTRKSAGKFKKEEKKKEKSTQTSKRQNPRSAVLASNEVRLSDVGSSSNGKKSSSPKKESTERKNTKPSSESRNDSSKTFSFQVGAFRDTASANRMADQLKKDGFSPFVVHAGNFYTVRVGKEKEKKDLYGLEAELKKKHYSFYLLSK